MKEYLIEFYVNGNGGMSQKTKIMASGRDAAQSNLRKMYPNNTLIISTVKPL